MVSWNLNTLLFVSVMKYTPISSSDEKVSQDPDRQGFWHGHCCLKKRAFCLFQTARWCWTNGASLMPLVEMSWVPRCRVGKGKAFYLEDHPGYYLDVPGSYLLGQWLNFKLFGITYNAWSWWLGPSSTAIGSLYVLVFLLPAFFFLQSELKSDTAYHAYFWHSILAKHTLLFDAMTNFLKPTGHQFNMLFFVFTHWVHSMVPLQCRFRWCHPSLGLASRGCKTKNLIIYHRISVIFILHDDAWCEPQFGFKMMVSKCKGRQWVVALFHQFVSSTGQVE